MSVYNDGALHIINVPLLTVVVISSGIMTYHDYDGRHLWFPFPRWLSERICVQCGGLIWRWRCWRKGSDHGSLLPFHAVCVQRPAGWPPKEKNDD